MRLMHFSRHHKLVSVDFMGDTCPTSPRMSSAQAEFILRQRYSRKKSLGLRKMEIE